MLKAWRPIRKHVEEYEEAIAFAFLCEDLCVLRVKDLASFHHRSQNDIAKARAAMIALQVDRPGPQRIGPKRAAGTTENRLIIDDLLSVQDDGRVAIDECNVQRLPLASGC